MLTAQNRARQQAELRLLVNARGFEVSRLHDRYFRGVHVSAEGLADLDRSQRLDILIPLGIPAQGAAELFTRSQESKQGAVLRTRYQLRIAIRFFGRRHFVSCKAA